MDAVILLLLVVAGVAGPWLIFRSLRGMRAMAAWFLVLIAPYLLLFLLLVSETDMTLSGERRAYNLQFGFVLISVLMTLPWLGANVIGMALGVRARPSPVSAPAVLVSPQAAAPRDDGRPDWSISNLDAFILIQRRTREIGAQLGVPEGALPTFTPPDGNDGDFLFREKFEYVYMGIDHGQPCFEHCTGVPDQMLYYIFRHRAYALAGDRMAERGVGADRYADELEEEQQAILAGIDPRWGVQFAHEAPFLRKQG